jgi:hypothetical protein
MTTTPDAIEAAIMAQALTTVLSAGGSLRESMTPYLFFRDPARSPAHLEIAVGILSTIGQGERQKSGGRVLADTEVRVALAYQLPTHLPTMRPPLVIGNEIRLRLLERTDTYPATFSLSWKREESAALVPGWVVVENVFSALHYMAT